MKINNKWIVGSLLLAFTLVAKAETPKVDAAAEEAEESAVEAPVVPTTPVAPSKIQVPAETPAMVPAVTPSVQAAPTSPTPDVLTKAAPEVTPMSPSTTNKMHFGFLAGLSLGTVSTGLPGSSFSIASNTHVGGAGGIFFDLPVTSFFSVQPQLLYIQKGGDLTVSNPIPYVPTTLHYDVLELPLLAMGKFGNDFIKAVVFAGPSAAIAINQSLTYSFNGQNTGIAPLYRSLDISIHAGVGTEIALTPNLTFNLNGRYIAGLVNIDNGPLTTTTLNTWLFLTGLSIGF